MFEMLNPWPNPVDQEAPSYNWYGNWARDSPRGKALESFQYNKSFGGDGTQIVMHQNRHIYRMENQDGSLWALPSLLQSVVPWKQHCLVSTMVKLVPILVLKPRISASRVGRTFVAMFDKWVRLQQLTIISEHLGSFTKELPLFSRMYLPRNCKEYKTMTPHWKFHLEEQLLRNP